jgi:RHS repeat-associated protein
MSNSSTNPGRLQTVDGVTTTYVIDVAAPLTMVLAETTGTESIYSLHGLNLIGQSDGVSMEYFTYDGLGSVRQVVDSAREVLYGQGFDPDEFRKNHSEFVGNPYLDAGDEKPSWGFTGEQTDENGLIFLRARYYQPGQGRLLTMDPWKGDQQRPMSLNPWLYTYGNPVMYTDPSGLSPLLCGIPFIGCLDTAKNTIIAAKVVYSQIGPMAIALSQREPWNNRFNCLDPRWSKPGRAIDLLADFFCERGPEWVEFFGTDSLSVELARSILLDEVRKEFYDNGDIFDPKERKFNFPEFGLALLDAINVGSREISLPLTHFLGSFDYRVTRSSSGRIEFQIYNRTDLASGTRIPLRFPPDFVRDNPYSLEQFILEHPEMENRGVFEILRDHPEIVSILSPKARGNTGFMMGGGDMRQTFNWSEQYLNCGLQNLPWPVYLPLLDIR